MAKKGDPIVIKEIIVRDDEVTFVEEDGTLHTYVGVYQTFDDSFVLSGDIVTVSLHPDTEEQVGEGHRGWRSTHGEAHIGDEI
jgi:hypothetical protein